MLFKMLKENLPWIAPSAAIVFAASGYFDRSYQAVKEAPKPTEQVWSGASATATSAPSAEFAAAEAALTIAPTTQAVAPAAASTTPTAEVTRQDTSSVLYGTGAVKQPVQPQAPAVAAQVAPAVEPVAPTQQTASLESNPAAFFNNAAANLEAANSCKEDLRVLASQARVYFPAGGLTVDEQGIEQARLIGIVAQNCPGVRIQVEGHSDPSGDPAVNLRLSQARAEQVVQRIGASGVDTSLFVAKGFGDRRPSGTTGPESTAYYDRRVEFSVVDVAAPTTFTATRNQWATPSCVAQLEATVAGTKLFYTPRSIAVAPQELDAVMQLASQAMNCPNVRLRIVGQHAETHETGENVNTGILRAKALMAMLVGRGIDAEQVIIAAPSRSVPIPGRADLGNSRVDFDIITD